MLEKRDWNSLGPLRVDRKTICFLQKARNLQLQAEGGEKIVDGDLSSSASSLPVAPEGERDDQSKFTDMEIPKLAATDADVSNELKEIVRVLLHRITSGKKLKDDQLVSLLSSYRKIHSYIGILE